ncbi:hypothetical protein MHW47_00260 [Streptomyces sp. OfavH-34-F]|uniref:hypothetical protein n=1 Tax=Streptomyces sp. OfavH-34-F TaxID=2917760 RepID=UPI001EF1D868|nr:hypothetical protein [Streptomyces sp. OfavH-34-F]MCG7522888.1 hypothetical protein [Streptomyces sp. OfavH-34-F]
MTTHWRRMDRTAMTGSLIAWPTHLDSYGGCGTSVYAVWPEAGDDPMVVCSRGLLLHAVQKEEPVGELAPWRTAFPDFDDHDTELAPRSDDLLGVLLLGTTGASWALRAPGAAPETPIADCFAGFWNATPQDLTAEGRTVADALTRCYGRPPLLLTVQDT